VSGSPVGRDLIHTVWLDMLGTQELDRNHKKNRDCIIWAMPTIDSDGCRPPVPTHGVQFFLEAGIGGRLASESVDGMLRDPERHV
jgi:hypothetical protein